MLYVQNMVCAQCSYDGIDAIKYAVFENFFRCSWCDFM